MASLNEIASSGASLEVIVELLAKQIEKRLASLETKVGSDYESKLEKTMAEIMLKVSEQPTINVKAASTAPVVNVAPAAVTIMEKESPSTIKMTFERSLSGAIESATIVKG